MLSNFYLLIVLVRSTTNVEAIVSSRVTPASLAVKPLHVAHALIHTALCHQFPMGAGL
jgi:hypothetical protein